MNDPLIYKGRLSLGTSEFMLDCVETARKNIPNLKTPFYLLHGKEDKFAQFEGSSKFYEETPIADKTIITIEGKIYLSRFGT
jgi:alpha-beta hydrolase superfamily lysophospholipase